MPPIMGKKRLEDFKTRFPFFGQRVVKWRPSGLFGICIYLSDHTQLYFSDTGKRQKLYTMHGKEKGKLIYDSQSDNRKGV